MAAATRRHLAIALLGTLALAGCEAGTNPFKGLGAGEDGPVASTASAPRSAGGADVESPDVFQTTAQGLWDGRPSLGGVWVATAEATDPERVMIRNPANGKSVVGALFKRERDNPGPPIQISSDAAEALGLLAGQPAELSVTALRRAEPEAAVAEAAPELAAAEAPAAIATAPLDTAAVSAAIDKADPAPKPRMDPAALTAAAPSAAAPAASAPSGGSSLIQLGIFSVEANAKRAADMVIKAGSPATVRKEGSAAKPYWSVVAGPAASPADREALMKKVKGLGFTDAYVVSR